MNLLAALGAWCATSVALGLGLGWVLRRYPPFPYSTPEEDA